MKNAQPDNQHFDLALDEQQKQLLDMLLRLYPQVPIGHWKLTKTGGLPDADSGQELLDDSHAEIRKAHQRQVLAWIGDATRLRPCPDGFVLRLSQAEAETFLQVLNDIRMGSWLALGSPTERLTRLTEKNAPHVWAMELSRVFQMELLEAMEGG